MTSTLSPQRLATFLGYIKFPKTLQKLDYNTLSILQSCFICAVPYENLGLHYSDSARISLDVNDIYDKCTINGRGGYCMENCILLNHVLRGIGFQAYIAGARARPRIQGVPQGDYTGWMHVVNIVTLADGNRFMVDVGFGGDLATKPLRLIAEKVTHNFGTQDVRLMHEPIPQTYSGQKFWVYQYRNHDSQDWNSAFCFSDVEFLPQDIEVLNFHTSQDPRCFQTYNVLVVKFLHGSDGIDGKLMLVNNEVKENLGGRTRLVVALSTEQERIDTLRKLFQIILSDNEISGIQSRRTALVSS